MPLTLENLAAFEKKVSPQKTKDKPYYQHVEDQLKTFDAKRDDETEENPFMQDQGEAPRNINRGADDIPLKRQNNKQIMKPK